MCAKRERRPGRAPCLIKLDLEDKKCLYEHIAESEAWLDHDVWIKVLGRVAID